MKLTRNERKNTYGVKLAGFETWKKQSRHLEPCSNISEEMPSLTIGTQDKAKEEDNKTHNFSLNLSIVSLLLISKSDCTRAAPLFIAYKVLKCKAKCASNDTQIRRQLVHEESVTFLPSLAPPNSYLHSPSILTTYTPIYYIRTPTL